MVANLSPLLPQIDHTPAMPADRISALPDSVLRRVISFLDAEHAPLTSHISRRWRTLWRETDAVNLDVRSYWGLGYDGPAAGSLFFRDGLAALHAAGRCPVRKLSVHIESYHDTEYLKGVISTSPGMDALLAAPAIRGLETLRIVLRAEFGGDGRDYLLPTSHVPCGSLRVLELQGCTLGPLGTSIFGHLEKLRMVSCIAAPEDLQALLDTAPNLARIYLRRVRLGEGVLLCCPKAVVSMALMHCHSANGIYLDAPNLLSLGYKGYLDQFPFSSTMPLGRPMNLQHLQLSFCSSPNSGYHHTKEIEPHVCFWESIGSFSHLRVLRLKLWHIHLIAVQPEQEDMYLSVFPELKVLEVKGSYDVYDLKSLELEGSNKLDSRGAAMLIANLLHCCPSIQELRLKFLLPKYPYGFSTSVKIIQDERKAQLDIEESVAFLERLKSGISTSPCFTADDTWCDDTNLSALKAHSFPCLESCLRKVRLEFEMRSLDCFEVKLAKFLVENTDVLEVMEVHDGNHRVYDHIHHKVAIWRANSSKGRINIVGSDKVTA